MDEFAEYCGHKVRKMPYPFELHLEWRIQILTREIPIFEQAAKTAGITLHFFQRARLLCNSYGWVQ